MGILRGDKRFKISTKVILSFLILVLLQGFISLFVLTTLISKTQNASFRNQMERTLAGIEGSISETLDNLRVNARLLSGQTKVIDYTDFGLKNLLKRELMVYKASLQVAGIGIYDRTDSLYTSVGDVLTLNNALKRHLQNAFSGILTSFIVQSGGESKLTVLSAITREEKIIGVLSLHLKMDRSFIHKLERITDSKVVLLLHGRETHGEELDGIQDILSAFASGRQEGKLLKVREFMVGTTTMAGIGEPQGKIFCLLDTGESRRLLTRYNTISLVFTLLILTLALLLAILFYRLTFYRPFQSVLNGVHRISEGNLHYSFRIPARDEFGELAQAFNKMRANLISRERELLHLSRYNNLILDNVRTGIITIDLNTRITTSNPAADMTLGKITGFLKGKSIRSKDLPPGLFKMVERSLNEDIHFTGQEVRIRQNGEDKILSLSTSPMFSEEGDLIGTIAIFEDITRVKKLEEKLAISSRLAALGEMAAGVAHQVRNPLTVMKVSCAMLRDNFTVVRKKGNYDRITHMLINEIDTLNLVVGNLLNFARPKRIQKSPCSIREIVQASLTSLPLDKYPELEITTEFRGEIPPCSLDKSLIEQVISNLVLNAIQASPQKGRIELRVFMKNSHLCLEVEDSGCGFDEETRSQIFNPFFSTKDNGTGLGLSISHRIVEQHGGSIEAQARPDRGALFRVLL